MWPCCNGLILGNFCILQVINKNLNPNGKGMNFPRKDRTCLLGRSMESSHNVFVVK